MDFKLLAALLLVGLVHGSEYEYSEVEIELHAEVYSYDEQVIENAFEIVNITATDQTNCTNGDGTLKYGHGDTNVMSYRGCWVRLTVVFIKQSTIFCFNETVGNDTNVAEISTQPDPESGILVGQIVSVDVVTQLSQTTCIFKTTFWYLGRLIITRNGCKAVFKIRYLRAPRFVEVVKRVGGGSVTLTFPGKTLVAVKIIFLFGTCSSYGIIGGSFQAQACAGFFLFCFAPSTLHCEISEDPKVVGFDKQHLNVTEPCMYNAVSFIFSEFCYFRVEVKVSIDQFTGAAVVTFVRIITTDIVILLDADTLTVDGVVIMITKTVTVIKRICFVKKLGFIEITLRCGIIIKWKGRLGMIKVWAPPCFSASVFGLCGNANWIRLDDLTAPAGQSVASLHVVPDTSPTPSTLPQCTLK